MSDSDQSDLDLDALKSIFGSTAFGDSPPVKEKKKKGSTKKNNKSNSKKATKTKKSPVNLDNLLNDIDFTNDNDDENGDNDFDFNFKNQDFNFKTENGFTVFEKKINRYFDLSFQTVRDDVIKEIEHILVEKDNFDDIIIDFIENLKHSIYEIISYEKSNAFTNQKGFYSVFEDFSNSFLTSFRQVGDFTFKSKCYSTNIVKSCRNLIQQKNPIFIKQMNEATSDVNREIEELNNARKSKSSLENKNQKQARSYFHQRVLLEGKLTALDEINDNLLKQIDKIQGLKNQLFLNTDNKFPDNEIVSRRLKNAVHFFKSSYVQDKKKDLDLLKSKYNKFSSEFNDLKKTVREVGTSLDMIVDCYSSANNTLPANITPISQTQPKPSSLISTEGNKSELQVRQEQRKVQIQQVNDMYESILKKDKNDE